MAATVSSLSQFGCQVNGVTLQSENPVWVRLPGLEAQQAIATWAQGGVAGLSFLRPLHPAVAACLCELDGVGRSEEKLLSDDGQIIDEREPRGSRREQILSGHASPRGTDRKGSGLPSLWVRPVG
jgi:hypothetical protein